MFKCNGLHEYLYRFNTQYLTSLEAISNVNPPYKRTYLKKKSKTMKRAIGDIYSVIAYICLNDE